MFSFVVDFDNLIYFNDFDKKKYIYKKIITLKVHIKLCEMLL